ncbi:MAG: hypothetical protein GY847_08055 [Proteobacteria bacterium]|nr:hypothetical protein [Pseudomonadota bacterium]
MSLSNKVDDPRARLEAAEKMTDEDKLVEIACTDDSPRVRLVAISRVNDDQKLIRVVKEANELDVRLVAVERISSQELIAELVKAKENLELTGMCFSRITDRKIIESIAEDPKSNPVARRMAVEHFADEAYLAEVYEAKTGRKSEAAVQAIIEFHGGGLRGVRAIGRFRRSEKALKALGTIALNGGDTGGLAVEYLCKALGSGNPKLLKIAADELAALSDPELIATLICSLDDTKLREPIRDVLRRIDTPDSRAALGSETEKG